MKQTTEDTELTEEKALWMTSRSAGNLAGEKYARG